jgi:hypothetical protein
MCHVSIRGCTATINAHPIEINLLKNLLNRAKYEGEFLLEGYKPCNKDWSSPLREFHIGYACDKGIVVVFSNPGGEDCPCKLSSLSHLKNPQFYMNLRKELRKKLQDVHEETPN